MKKQPKQPLRVEQLKNKIQTAADDLLLILQCNRDGWVDQEIRKVIYYLESNNA